MSDQQRTERGAAEENSGTPVTATEHDASRRPPGQPGAGRDIDDSDPQEAHGGSMAPSLVDDTGDPVGNPPPSS